ncbi:inactive Ufm1-specific protease 1 [Varanus komodoensis]|uniref:inactive Ufm1-specific protease 1 n=1 Tax=Varanus komodoensis TaxID=61221 RepID=UPI001CF784C4|nr:inactive Ufm1-specific protease 1 [Varanus komodoensis]
MPLLSSVHVGLPAPAPLQRLALVSGPYAYYHYGCDGLDDRGWGCGYRTLQTVCSWLGAAGAGGAAGPPVPSLRQIQSALVQMGDKPPSFAGSRDWIGTVEAALCLDHFYAVPGRLLHVPRGRDLREALEALYAHFQGGGPPVMMGGDRDNASKGLLGVCSGPTGHFLLVLDPHHYGLAGSVTADELRAMGRVCWRELGSFEAGSFYNLCLAQFARSG